MKTLQLGKFYPILGGVEKVMWDLTLGLASSGVQSDMLCACLKPNMPTEGILYPVEGARVICVPAIAEAASTMLSPSMISKLRLLVKTEAYDVVHIHHPDPMAAIALMISGYRGPVVLHYHSDIVGKRLFHWLYRPLEKWLINKAQVIIGTTPTYTAESPYLLGNRHKTETLPIGVRDMSVDVDAAKVLDIRKRFEGKKLVFSLGRLVEYKGFPYLIEAAGELGEDYHIVIGGSGPLREKLQKQILESGLQDRVTLLGRIPDEDLPSWYKAADVFCLSSIYKTEAFAIAQVEAMSCGTPVVATWIPESGVSWVNSHGHSGLNANPADPKALAWAIRELCSDEDNYTKYSVEARARYEELFQPQGMIDGCIDIYKNKLKLTI